MGQLMHRCCIQYLCKILVVIRYALSRMHILCFCVTKKKTKNNNELIISTIIRYLGVVR
jgi:hypothetical protein